MKNPSHPFRTMLACLTSPSTFKDVLRMNLGSVLLVLAVLALATAFYRTVHLYSNVYSGLGELAKGYEENLPPLSIQDGVATVEGEQPAIYPKPDSVEKGADPHRFVVIYDTTGNTAKIPAKYRGGILVTSDTLILKNNEYSTREIPISELHQLTGDIVLDGEFIERSKGKWAGILAAAGAFFLLIAAVISKLIHALLLGLVGLTMAGFRGGLTYGASFKLALFALTPAVLLEIALGLVGQKLPFLIYFGAAVVYLWLGVRNAAGAGSGGRPGEGEKTFWPQPESQEASPEHSDSLATQR